MAQSDFGLPDPVGDFNTRADTYHHFMLGVKWVALSFAAMLAFLILSFATPAGIVAGLVAGALVFAVGVYALRHGLAHSSEREMGYPTHR